MANTRWVDHYLQFFGNCLDNSWRDLRWGVHFAAADGCYGYFLATKKMADDRWY